MSAIRPAALAGSFYPAAADQLAALVRDLLTAAPPPPPGPAPKAIIAPHAGLIYSGPTAAAAYRRLEAARGRITRVVLLGPAHRVYVRGLALPAAEAFATPLGPLTVDRAWAARLEGREGVVVSDAVHAPEHCLEVHLPFLQAVLGPAIALVPVVVGDATPTQIAEVLETLWGGPETLVVISSDLSHFLPYDQCQALDGATTRAIEALDASLIGRDQACGRLPIAGLLAVARRLRLRVETVDVRNSGDTAGPRDRVVGYGAWAFYPPDSGAGSEQEVADPVADLLTAHGADLLRLAAGSIRHGLAQGTPLPVEEDTLPTALRRPGATFVTLTRTVDDALRGCIGSAQAWRGLVPDVVDNAFKAAFADPRFPPLTAAELPGLTVSLSVLSSPVPLPFSDQADVLRRLRPGVDGLILEDKVRGRMHRGLFLPSVWEQLPEAPAFLAHLKRKAGLPVDHWSDGVRIQRFTTHAVKAAGLWS